MGQEIEGLLDQPNPLQEFLEEAIPFIKKKSIKKERKVIEEEEEEGKSFLISQIPRTGKNNTLLKKDILDAIEELDPEFEIPPSATKEKLLNKYYNLSVRENKETLSNTLKNTGRPNLNSTLKKEGTGMAEMRLGLLEAESESGNSAAKTEFKKIISRLKRSKTITSDELRQMMQSFRNA